MMMFVTLSSCALRVRNNEFLQEMWNVKQLKIMNGIVSFEANPRICVTKIKKFISDSTLVNSAIDTNTIGYNGYTAIC